MQNHGRGDEHFQFMERTDRKSLHTQIGLLVAKAQQTAQEELQERSQRLKNMLDNEDKQYEQEFASKVKNRLDDEIRNRQERLNEIKAARDKRHKEFCDAKRMQQVMLNCYELREALRQKDREDTRICLEEQMQENLRMKRRECERENYWLQLEKRRWEEYDRVEEYERRTREQLKSQITKVLEVQLEEHEEKRQKELAEKRQDTINADKLIEELRLEDFDYKHRELDKNKEKYRNELLEEIRRRKCEKIAQWEAEKAEHEEFIRETQRLEAEAKERICRTKRELARATHEYIAYVRRMRNLELGIEKMMNDRTDDLFHVDYCCKNNVAERTRAKREETARCHAYLKKQICEEIERKMRLEAEVHENKMPENRFVHPPVTRTMIRCQQRQRCLDLNAQIKEMKRIQAEEERAFEQKLLKAVDDPEVCIQLAAQFLQEPTDYLPAHPNWKIHACPKNKYVAKPPMSQQQMDELIAKTGIDSCPFPKAARNDCGLMAQVCDRATPAAKKSDAGAEPEAGGGDTQPKTQRDAFKSCKCDVK